MIFEYTFTCRLNVWTGIFVWLNLFARTDVVWVSDAGTFPIDTTKTRLQIQGQKIDARYTELKYRGMSHAFFRILREEGALALYSGLVCKYNLLDFVVLRVDWWMF